MARTGSSRRGWIRGGGGLGHIYASHVLADGTIPISWTTDGVALALGLSSQEQSVPAICSDGAGGAIVTWEQKYSVSDHDIYGQHITGAGVTTWGPDGIAVCYSTFIQARPAVAPDGGGGAFIVWQDQRTGQYDIFAQHLTSTGSIAAGGWVPNGILACAAINDQVNAKVVTDGAGGCVLCWEDNRVIPDAIYTVRLTSTGGLAPGWAGTGNLAGSGAGSEFSCSMIPDNAGGAMLVWHDFRVLDADIYGQHMTGAGIAAWTAGGIPLCSGPLDQLLPVVCGDGGSGMFVAWRDHRGLDYDVYAQHITASGSVASGWPSISTGLAICTATGNQYESAVVSDGAGGAIFCWTDLRDGFQSDIYAQHVTAAGSIVAGWASNGNVVSSASFSQSSAAAVTDGASGAVIAFLDDRSNDFAPDLYAQRIDRFGRVGNPEPAIARIRDVAQDQGGKVAVEWTASYLDAFPSFEVQNYAIWRRVPTTLALASLRSGARLMDDATRAEASSGVALRTSVLRGQTVYWEYVTSLPARGFAGYSYTATTTTDSMPGSNPRTSFMVEADDAGGLPFWDSAADSGYSVDNLGPAMPAPFTGAYLAGATHLHWGRNGESDLAGYRLYRGGSSGFVPVPGNRIASLSDTGYADVGAAGSYYKLSAIDAHGNESPFALLSPGGIVDVVSAALPGMVSLAPASPNPAHGPLVVRFALPRAMPAQLAIFDPAGRLVRSLASGEQAAGEHAIPWDGRAGSGAQAASGLYFVRLVAGGRMLTMRVISLR